MDTNSISEIPPPPPPQPFQAHPAYFWPPTFWNPNVPPPSCHQIVCGPQWDTISNSWLQYGNYSTGNHHHTVAASKIENVIDTNEGEIGSRRDIDQKFVNNFIAERLSVTTSKKLRKSVNIANFRVVLKRCVRLVQELKTTQAAMKDTAMLIGNEDASWDSLSRRAILLQGQIKSYLDEVRSPETLTNMKQKLQKIGKKRDRLKRQKLRRNDLKVERDKRNKLVHEKLDSWLKSIRQQYLDSEMEKKMKKEADAILSEVRRKKAEATRTLSLVKAVEKLRAVKKMSSEAKGLFSSLESDSRFADSVSRFESILSKRLVQYGEEERTLQAMLDEERRETRDAEKRRRFREHNDRVEAIKCDIVSSLFGHQAEIDGRDPRFYCWEFYTRAERDLDTLIHVRREWDVWLTSESETPISGNVPVGWIQPSKPSSDAWASMLVKQ